MQDRHRLIYHIEDSIEDIDTVQEVIEQHYPDYEVRVAESGEEALNELLSMHDNEEWPNLILLDFVLGDHNAIEVANEIKEYLPPIPVIVMTAGRDGHDVALTYRSCANAYVIKPSTFEGYEELVESVHKIWLEGPQPLWASRENNDCCGSEDHHECRRRTDTIYRSGGG